MCGIPDPQDLLLPFLSRPRIVKALLGVVTVADKTLFPFLRSRSGSHLLFRGPSQVEKEPPLGLQEFSITCGIHSIHLPGRIR